MNLQALHPPSPHERPRTVLLVVLRMEPAHRSIPPRPCPLPLLMPFLACGLQLASTEEWIDGQFSGNLGEVLIRCNNVLYLRGVPEEDDS